MKKIKFKNIANFTAGQSPESKYYTNNTSDTPFLQGNRTFGFKYPKIDTYTTKITKIAHNGEILISVRAPVGDLNIANQDICIGRGIGSINAKNNQTSFLYYCLKYNVKNLLKQGNGTTYSSITGDILNDFVMCIPSDDPNIQKKIGGILENIDAKIENNNQINNKLEEMMKTIYQRWFLEFEFPNKEGKPYKSSGGKMIWNEELRKEIPEGWEVKSLKDLVKKDTRKYELNKIVKTIDLSVMPSSSISLNDLNTSDKFSSNLNIMDEGNILFGSIRPYLNKAGIAPCNGAVAGTVYSYKVLEDNNYNLILITLTNNRMFEFALSRAKGTRMPVVSSDDLLSYKVAYNKDIVKEFNNYNIKNIICKNIQENQKLIELRDYLLPMLMNGQINVYDVKI